MKLATNQLLEKQTDLRTHFLITKKRKELSKERISPREVLSEARNIYIKKDSYQPKMASNGEYVENLTLKEICPDCREDPPDLVEEFSSGDMVCGSCGLVLKGRIVDTRS